MKDSNPQSQEKQKLSEPQTKLILKKHMQVQHNETCRNQIENLKITQGKKPQ